MGSKFVAVIPTEAGKVVSVAVYRGNTLLLACENGVYLLDTNASDQTLVRKLELLAERETEYVRV